MKKLISIVSPAFNEEQNIAELERRLVAVFESNSNYDFEVIFVDNGSSDRTFELLEKLHSRDARFKVVQLSRNFSAPGGVTAGIQFAAGDALIVMCADLQDPPEKIPHFLTEWEKGNDIVYQIVTERRGVSALRKFLSIQFHRLIHWLSGEQFPVNGTVYRLMDRKVYLAFNQLKETNRYFPGLCHWLGFKQLGIEFPRDPRFAGEAKSPFRVVFAFSYAPLKLINVLAVVMSLGSISYFSYIVVSVLLEGRRSLPGIPALTALMMLLFGILFFTLGIFAEYIARIYDEAKGRPIFVVRSTLGIGEGEEQRQLMTELKALKESLAKLEKTILDQRPISRGTMSHD